MADQLTGVKGNEQASDYAQHLVERTETANSAVSARSPPIAFGRMTTTTATTMALEYRVALPDDVAECLDVRGRTRENAISAEGLRARGITPQSWAEDIRQGVLPGHVCLADGKIIGFCFGVRESGEVAVLALLPAFENQGIGRSLLNRVVQELKTFGFNRLFLGCSPDPSTRSYGFYRHLGWRSTGMFDAAGDEVLEYFFEGHEPQVSRAGIA